MLVAGVPQNPARNKRGRNVVAIQSAGLLRRGGEEVVVREVNGGGCGESGPVPAWSGSSQTAYHPHLPATPSLSVLETNTALLRRINRHGR